MNEEKPATQHKKQYDWLKPYQWEKGQSGNPEGGKKGKRLKTMVAEMFENMTDEEKKEFLNHIDPEIVWKMAEGNPRSEDKVELDIPSTLVELIKHGTSNQTGNNQIPGENTE